MAIPFAFPSDEDTEANYQHLDQLLSDLFTVLQQILLAQRRIRDANHQLTSRNRNVQNTYSRRIGDNPEPPPLPTQHPSGTSRLNIPDTQSARSVPVQQSSAIDNSSVAATQRTDILHAVDVAAADNIGSPTRRRRRRRRNASESSCCEESKPSGIVQEATQDTAEDWTQVGANLRKIADDFQATVVGKDDSQSEDGKRPCGVEANGNEASLLSMLVPPPFSGSIWTAVIFVVGWRLLSR